LSLLFSKIRSQIVHIRHLNVCPLLDNQWPATIRFVVAEGGLMGYENV
jgi:hypothetical protein